MNPDNSLAELNEMELIALAPTLTAWKRKLLTTEDEIAQFMYRGGPTSPTMSAKPPESTDNRPEKSYWEAVKKEMHVFLCSNDTKYEELWKRINALEEKTTTAIVGVIAAFLGASIGVLATVISGFVAVCLYASIKIGKEAYCRYAETNQA